MPVYNAVQYVSEAIESILSQTFEDFEFVIVDDGSTDGSSEILNNFAKRDSRIRLISRENKGLVASLNEGIAAARGEFIARMDADDISLSDRFEKQLELFWLDNDLAAVGCQRTLIDSDGDSLNLPRLLPTNHENIDADNLNGVVSVVHPSTMIRKSALQAVGGYRSWSIGEDLDLWLRLAESQKLANLSDVLLKYRVTPSSYTSTRNDQAIVNTIIADAYRRRGIERSLEHYAAHARSCSRFRCFEDYSRSCSWRALKAGNYRTARKHALRSAINNPLSFFNWKLLARTLMESALPRQTHAGSADL